MTCFERLVYELGTDTAGSGDDREIHWRSIATAFDPQGARFVNALPVGGSTGIETWSCTMSQLLSNFRKHAVKRTQASLLLPSFVVPLIRLRLYANATSSPTVIVRSRISYSSGR